jgi:hypothetical protein
MQPGWDLSAIAPASAAPTRVADPIVLRREDGLPGTINSGADDEAKRRWATRGRKDSTGMDHPGPPVSRAVTP